jgi:hypothetical protein
MIHDILDLKKDTLYNIYIVGQCDGTCLREISKTQISSQFKMSCSSTSIDCHTQTIFYDMISVTTSKHSDHNNNNDNNSNSNDNSIINTHLIVIIIITLIICAIITIFVILHIRRKYEIITESDEDPLNSLEMTDFSFDNNNSNNNKNIHTVGGNLAINDNLYDNRPKSNTVKAFMSKVNTFSKSNKNKLSTYSPLRRDLEDDEDDVTINL